MKFKLERKISFANVFSAYPDENGEYETTDNLEIELLKGNRYAKSITKNSNKVRKSPKKDGRESGNGEDKGASTTVD